MKQPFDVEAAYHLLVGDNRSLDTFPWTDFTRALYERWIKQRDIYSPFTAFQEALFPIDSYSQRISCLTCLQQAVNEVIDDEQHQKEWTDDISALIKYNERLRELKQQDIIITAPKWEDNICTMDEVSLLFEHITPEELVAFMQVMPQFIVWLKPKRSLKNLLSFYSHIYGEKRIAGLSNKSITDFLIDYRIASLLRSIMIAGKSVLRSIQFKPLPISFRNECFEIYIRERTKKIYEQLVEADDTRPYPPTEQECLGVMLDQDKAELLKRQAKSSDETNAHLQQVKNNPLFKQVMKSVWLKLKQVKQKYGELTQSLDMSAFVIKIIGAMPSTDKLDQCYLRYLEDRMLHADHVHYAPKPNANEARIAEDVTYEEVRQGFQYITDLCVQRGMQQHVENHLRTACLGSAEALWKCIHEYEYMGYLSTANLHASVIYAAICAYFGKLPYDERNFRKYR